MAKSAGVALRRNEAPTKGVARIANAAIDRALQIITEPTEDPAEDVHAIRTTTKQLRALFRLIRPLIADETFRTENAHLRKAAGLLAGSRDAAVALQTLNALGKYARTKSARIALEEAAVILQHVAPQQEHTVSPATFRRVAAALEAARPRWGASVSRQEQWHGVIEGFVTVYRACRSRAEKAARVGDYASCHQWRIRVKNLYYQALYLAPIWPKRLKRMSDELQKLQCDLGDLHDLAVLQGLLTKHLQSSEAISVVMEVIDCRRGKLQKRSFKRGARLFRRKPRKLAERLATRVDAWVS